MCLLSWLYKRLSQCRRNEISSQNWSLTSTIYPSYFQKARRKMFFLKLLNSPLLFLKLTTINFTYFLNKQILWREKLFIPFILYNFWNNLYVRIFEARPFTVYNYHPKAKRFCYRKTKAHYFIYTSLIRSINYARAVSNPTNQRLAIPG